MPFEPMPWTLFLRNWRGISELKWSPFGVSLLTGPNGSGKTSILTALSFLRTLSERGLSSALEHEGNVSYLRYTGAEASEPIELRLCWGSLEWQITLAVEGRGIHEYHGELLKKEDKVLFRKALFQTEWYDKDGTKRSIDNGTCLRVAKDLEIDPDIGRFFEFVKHLQLYRTYEFNKIRSLGTPHLKSDILHRTGQNLFAVLRNWRSASRAYDGNFEWVLSALKKAFPDQLEDMEFIENTGGVDGRFYPPGADPDGSLPLSVSADGLLAGILHLTAVAGAKEGSVLAFDEIENHLHPHAIREILQSMRDRAEEKNLTILLTTHSPVLMNAYKGYEDQFFVIHRKQDLKPQALDELEDPDWLAHFSLGDLYSSEKIASPTERRGSARP